MLHEALADVFWEAGQAALQRQTVRSPIAVTRIQLTLHESLPQVAKSKVSSTATRIKATTRLLPTPSGFAVALLPLLLEKEGALRGNTRVFALIRFALPKQSGCDWKRTGWCGIRVIAMGDLTVRRSAAAVPSLPTRSTWVGSAQAWG